MNAALRLTNHYDWIAITLLTDSSMLSVRCPAQLQGAIGVFTQA